MLLAIAGLTACENNIEPAVTEDSGRVITLSAVNESGSATRAALVGGSGEDKNNVKFESGDFLYVSGETGSLTKFEMAGEPKSDGSADFKGLLSKTDKGIYALYSPASVSPSFTISDKGATIENVGIYSDQTVYEGTFDKSNAISVGVAGTVGGNGICPIVMKHFNALLKFQVASGFSAKKAVLSTDASDPSIAGGVSILLKKDGSFSFTANSSVTSITLTGEMTPGHDYYFSVLPVTLTKGLTISLYEEENSETPFTVITSSKTIAFTSGSILNIGGLSLWKGKGTESSPYEISNLSDFLKFKDVIANTSLSSDYCDKYYKQTTDIDCDGKAMGIGSASLPFKGHYDGNGKKITNYALGGATPGLFTNINGATIENLSVKPVKTVCGDLNAAGKYETAGCLVGQADGNCTISRCTLMPFATDGQPYICNVNLVSGNRFSFGGLVGKVTSSSMFEYCTNDADISIQQTFKKECDKVSVGGIVGYVENPASEAAYLTIDRCRNKGKVSAVDSDSETVSVGGILGYITESSPHDFIPHISNCVNSGYVYSYADNTYDFNNGYAGGIIGCNGSNGVGSDTPWVRNCLNKGDIFAYGNDASGAGIIGYCYDKAMKVQCCVNIGQITNEGDGHPGAICGMGDADSYTGGDCSSCFWREQGALNMCYNQDVGTPSSSISAETVNQALNNFVWASSAANWIGSWSGSASTLNLDF